MKNLVKHTLGLLGTAIVLALTLVTGQTLPEVKAAESSGTLGARFGTGGIVTTDFAGSDDGARSVAVQPDGKIVAAGSAVIGGSGRFALARYE